VSTIVVTGAGGFIGSHLTDALLRRGDSVVAVDLTRKPSPNLTEASQHPSFQYRECDVTVPSSVRKAFAAQPSAVIHAAAGVGVKAYLRDPMNTIESSVIGTRTVLRESMKSKTRFLYLSSSEVFGRNPAVPWSETADRVLGDPSVTRWSYSTSKGVCEHLVNAAHLQFGLPTSIVRPFNTYGPRQRPAFVIPLTVHRLLNGLPPVVYGDGLQTRCFTYIDDLVEGILKCLDLDAATGESFNIGNPREWSVRDAIRLVSEAMQSDAAPVHEDPQVEFGAGFDEIPRRVLDVAKASQLLKWNPREDLPMGIECTVKWARANPDWQRLPRSEH
jgi:dTDP-alpha-D-glucuronic acid decarboxylase